MNAPSAAELAALEHAASHGSEIAARAGCHRLLDYVAELIETQDRHLSLIAHLSRSTPFDGELAECRSARAALISEVGTLRATVEGIKRRVRDLENSAIASASVLEKLGHGMTASYIRGLVEEGTVT